MLDIFVIVWLCQLLFYCTWGSSWWSLLASPSSGVALWGLPEISVQLSACEWCFDIANQTTHPWPCSWHRLQSKILSDSLKIIFSNTDWIKNRTRGHGKEVLGTDEFDRFVCECLKLYRAVNGSNLTKCFILNTGLF